MIDELTKRLPLATAFMLALSVVYDYFFLRALSLSFGELPTTITDHARSAIVWLPGLVIASGAGYLLGVSSPERNDGGGLPRSSRYLDMYIFRLLGPASILLTLMLEWEYTAWAIATFAALALFRFQPRRGNIELRLGEGSARLLLVIPAAVALVGGSGWKAGQELLTARTRSVTVELRSGSTTKEVNINGLRRFDQATVLVGESRSIEVISSADVLRVQHKAARSQGALCHLMGLMCRSDGVPSLKRT